MTTPNDADVFATQAVDWIFTYYATQPTWDRHSLGVPVGAPANYPRAGMEAPPEIKEASDLRAANEWLQREWDRLKQYTEIQLARIQRESQALLSQNHLNEQTMILGCQELSRKEELLARQSRALQQQAANLSQRETALTEQFDQWSRLAERAVRCQSGPPPDGPGGGAASSLAGRHAGRGPGAAEVP